MSKGKSRTQSLFDRHEKVVNDAPTTERLKRIDTHGEHGIEYQIGITDGNIHEFDKYLVDPHGIGDEVIKRAKIWDKPDNYQTKKEA